MEQRREATGVLHEAIDVRGARARFEPTDFKMTMGAGADGLGNGQIEFARLELTPLRQIAASLPLPLKWREDLARIAPSGTLENTALQWRGDPDTVQAFSGSGRFVDLGLAGQESLPTVTGMTGTFDVSPQGASNLTATHLRSRYRVPGRNHDLRHRAGAGAMATGQVGLELGHRSGGVCQPRPRRHRQG
jgi:hypothetical protein